METLRPTLQTGAPTVTGTYTSGGLWNNGFWFAPIKELPIIMKSIGLVGVDSCGKHK